MRLIVCGGRDFTDRESAFACLDYIHLDHTITHIIEGGARGADRLGREWAIAHNIPFTTVKANWDLFGKSAGYKRNIEMATQYQAQGCFALPGGVGTQHMINIAKHYCIPVATRDDL